MTVTALALAEPPEDDYSYGHLSLVQTIGTSGDDQDLDRKLEEARALIAQGNRLMADLAAEVNSHQTRRNHLRVVTDECEQRIKDTADHMIKDLEDMLKQAAEEGQKEDGSRSS